MEAALLEAQAAEVSEPFLEEIKRVLATERRKLAAREALQAAVRCRRVAELQAALAEAEQCHLEGPELYEAKRTLADEQSKVQARAAVEKAGL